MGKIKTQKNKKHTKSLGYIFSKVFTKCTTYINSIFNKLNTRNLIETKKSHINQKNLINLNYSLRKNNNVDLVNIKRVIKLPEKLVIESEKNLKKKIKKPRKTVKKTVKKNVKKTASIKKRIGKRPPVKESTKLMIYEKQNDKCALCDKSLGIGRIIDHVLMRSLGGCDNINNYQGLCATCNKCKTVHFDQFVRNYFKNNSKTTIDFNQLLNLQKEQYNDFFGQHPIINID